VRDAAPPSATDGPWAPLASPVYRKLWAAQGASNLGAWMHVVVAQWVTLRVSGSPLLVALVQTASTLPMVLLAAPAGVLADVLDRRKVLIVVELGMFVSGAVLALTTLLGCGTAVAMLAFTFLIGCGSAVLWPAWQATQPELVARSQIAQATSLGSVNVNLARVFGPALGGALIAVAGAGIVFAVTAALFGIAGLTVASWRRTAVPDPVGRERVLSGLRSGARYVRNARSMRRVLVQSLLFVPAATSLWALLPLLAGPQLHLGPQGFGLLLGALGGGAVLATLLLPVLRRHLVTETVLTASFLLYALSLGCLATTRWPALALLLLATAGAAWLGLLSTLNAVAQLVLPEWVRARGLSYFIVVIGGSQAAGGVIWGVLATRVGVRWTFAIAAGMLACSALLARRFPLLDPNGLDVRPSIRTLPSELDGALGAEERPVLVVVDYRIREGEATAFLRAMSAVARVRRRTGARRWDLFWDPAVPQRYVETFMVGSWEEHRRQHLGRMTVLDRRIVEDVNVHLAKPVLVSHLIAAEVPLSSSPRPLSARQLAAAVFSRRTRTIPEP